MYVSDLSEYHEYHDQYSSDAMACEIHSTVPVLQDVYMCHVKSKSKLTQRSCLTLPQL